MSQAAQSKAARNVKDTFESDELILTLFHRHCNSLTIGCKNVSNLGSFLKAGIRPAIITFSDLYRKCLGRFRIANK